MPKEGEKAYLKRIGAAGRAHAAGKPFSDAMAGMYLADMGALVQLLSHHGKGRLLDVGCGTGWTSRMLARCGWDVTGIDIASDMIDVANELKEHEEIDNVRFQVADFETFEPGLPFDFVVFYDSLHHSEDERAALRMAYACLKPGGTCITCEPGYGHAKAEAAKKAIREFGVTEKDMPPALIRKLAREIGFRGFRLYPHMRDICRLTYGAPESPVAKALFRFGAVRSALPLFVHSAGKFRAGTVVLTK